MEDKFLDISVADWRHEVARLEKLRRRSHGVKARPCIAACDTSSVDEAKRREWRGAGSGPEESDQVAVRITPKRYMAAVHR